MVRVVCLAIVCAVALCACGAGQPPSGGAEPPGSAPAPGPPPAAASAPAPSASPAPGPSATAPDPGPGGARFERIHTGQPEPSLAVTNAYPKGQHVLIDGASVGEVPPGARAVFAVTPGVHTVTCADRADGQGMPTSITETFESGYEYRYEIRPR